MSPEKRPINNQPVEELDVTKQEVTIEKQGNISKKILATIGISAIMLTGIDFGSDNKIDNENRLNVDPTEQSASVESNTIESLFSIPTVYAKKKTTKKKVKKVKAKKPVSFKMKNGKRVCAKKNDKPSMSTKNKTTHMDMECCLDPDEKPNPYCSYPRVAYGELLDTYNKNPF